MDAKKMDRTAQINRETKETQVVIELNLDGSGESEIDTSYNFMDHMLTLLAKHSQIDLKVKADGDLTHHIIEDIGISLGQGILKALGDKKGLNRYGTAFVPMDESLARCVIDFSGRKALDLDLQLNECDIEDVAVEDVYHFFNSFAENAKMNLHLHILYGMDQHHKVEAAFKSLARAIKKAKKIVSDEIPSTKGSL
ncbi:MAG: Imidazoleglycerol-phosphate dehydratase [Promethearchaeota archaeon]|jgi:imidazoleglycerol-phosphate dehydratase|nr:MAG: Imidazoleglycerol-phosphate dehydratase [Candidatus Lokiarchaeota archaeon]